MIAAAITFAIVFPHSLVPGGIDIWSGFPMILKADTPAYVDYRADDGRVLWARTTLRKGEIVIADRWGNPLRRARCGNDVALTPPPDFVPPPKTPDLDIPVVTWVVPPDLAYTPPGITFEIPDIPEFVPPVEVPPIPPVVTSIPPPPGGIVLLPLPPVWWGGVPTRANVPELGTWMLMVGGMLILWGALKAVDCG